MKVYCCDQCQKREHELELTGQGLFRNFKGHMQDPQTGLELLDQVWSDTMSLAEWLVHNGLGSLKHAV